MLDVSDRMGNVAGIVVFITVNWRSYEYVTSCGELMFPNCVDKEPVSPFHAVQ